MAQYWLNSTLL